MKGMGLAIEPIDLPTYAMASLILGATALLALWIPARRATRADPMATLKQG